MKPWPLILLIACTPITEEQRYEREAKHAEAWDDYNQMARQCKASGGTPVIERTTREYTIHDLRRAYCARL